MRVGSFIVMRDPCTRGWDAIHFIPREADRLPEHTTRIGYERECRMAYLHQVLLFLMDTRLPTDPSAWDILMGLWPDLKPELERQMLDRCIDALLQEPNKENPNDIPF